MVGPAFERSSGTCITRFDKRSTAMVFGLDKAPDQIMGSLYIVDKLLVQGGKIGKAAMTWCFFPDEMTFHYQNKNRQKGVYSLAQAS